MNNEVGINGRSFAWAEIKAKEPGVLSDDPYAVSILDFIKQWISGQETFEFRTSGSTGKPKQIALTRRQISVSAKTTLAYFDLKPGDRAFMCLNPEFIGGRMMLARVLIGNLNMYAATPSAHPFETVNEHERFDFAAMTPHQIKGVFEAGERGVRLINRMKAVILGGAPVPASLLGNIRQLKAPVFATYGMTETASHVALKRLNGADPPDFYEAVGRVRLAQDSRGCLVVNGPVTNFQDVATNDRVELLGKKRFRWLGRVDNVVNSGGVKIQVEELEQKVELALQALNQEARFFVFGLPDEALGEKVCIAFEEQSVKSDRLDLEKIERTIGECTGRYERPKRFFVIPKFAETASGKLDRKKTIDLLI